MVLSGFVVEELFGTVLGVLGDVLGFGELCGVADGEFGITVVDPGSLGAALGVLVVALGAFVVADGVCEFAPGMLFCWPAPGVVLCGVLCVPELCPIPVPL